jgi:hypothetical protein
VPQLDVIALRKPRTYDVAGVAGPESYVAVYCTVASAPRCPNAVSPAPTSSTAPPSASIEMPASFRPLLWASSTRSSSADMSTSGPLMMWEVAANASRSRAPPGPVWHWSTGIDEHPA